MKKNNIYEKAKEILESKNNIMVLSGAGLSTDAGIPDFRSEDGLYSKKFKDYNPEDVLSIDFLESQPDLFYEYIRENMCYFGTKPTKVYKYITKLQNDGKVRSVVTQNIDKLHDAAGTSNVFEVHGNLVNFYCTNCGEKYSSEEMLKDKHSIYCDKCNHLIRPDVVLYGEALKDFNDMLKEVDQADALLVLGSSLKVYPVALIPNMFLDSGKEVIIINNQETSYKGRKNVCEINEGIDDAFMELFPGYKDFKA